MIWRLDPRSRKVQGEGSGIAFNKIENSVPSGIHSGEHVRPGHGALRGDAARELAEGSFAGQPGKVRHYAFLHVFPQKDWVHGIDAQDNHLLVAVPGTGSTTGA
jgi:hypothetical protein